MYTFGFGEIPECVPVVPEDTIVFGKLQFILWWTILPTLYVSYFLVLWENAKGTPGSRIQRVLCGFAIFHFLFLTDMVDYSFGRGYHNKWAEAGHWTERISWRIAILLPLYQKLKERSWLKHEPYGPLLHQFARILFTWFAVYQCILNDVPRLLLFITGWPSDIYHQFAGYVYVQQLGYYGYLFIMVMLFTFSKKKVSKNMVSITMVADIPDIELFSSD